VDGNRELGHVFVHGHSTLPQRRREVLLVDHLDHRAVALYLKIAKRDHGPDDFADSHVSGSAYIGEHPLPFIQVA
jgi:hypothetical protein